MSNTNTIKNDQFLKNSKLSPVAKGFLLDHFNNSGPLINPDIAKKANFILKKCSSQRFKNLSPMFHINSISSFLHELKSIEFFRKFSTVNLLIHEKGLNSCLRYEYSDLGIKLYSRDIADFNKLFQSIKKSKNKSFGQSSLKGVDFEILGTFLAKNFSLTKHNAILIISRDDFLPQTEEDITLFNEFCIYIEYYLETLSKLLAIEEKVSLIEKFFNNIPFDIHILFSGEEDKLTSLASSKDSTFFVDKSTIVIKQCADNNFDHVDLFHKERIKLLGDLLNTLRHEISNPLFGLKLTAELLTSEKLNETQREFIDEILISLNRCTSIIEDFTNLYRSDKELRSVVVEQIVNEVLTLTKSETKQIIRQKNIQMTESPITVNTNPTWLVQILFNLIVNAAHALTEAQTHNPKISITVEVKNNIVLFYVKDNGPNIQKDKLEEVFKPFFTTKTTGTGLGLSISRNLAKKIGGDLEYLAELGGACFKLSVPHE